MRRRKKGKGRGRGRRKRDRERMVREEGSMGEEELVREGPKETETKGVEEDRREEQRRRRRWRKVGR